MGSAKAQKRRAHDPRRGVATLTIGARGVVYNNIGTWLLYAIDQIFLGPAGVAPTPDNVLGAISLAIWTITPIVASEPVVRSHLVCPRSGSTIYLDLVAPAERPRRPLSGITGLV
jgi:K+ transporter